MTPKQWDHLNQLTMQMDELVRKKYVKGSAEHDGDLLDLTALQLVDEAIGECVDQMTYLLTLRRKLLDATKV